jgi:hypothetical protein
MCKTTDFTTMLRVSSKDTPDTIRARLRAKLSDIHTYDIYLPSFARMPEQSRLEEHTVKERVRPTLLLR